LKSIPHQSAYELTRRPSVRGLRPSPTPASGPVHSTDRGRPCAPSRNRTLGVQACLQPHPRDLHPATQPCITAKSAQAVEDGIVPRPLVLYGRTGRPCPRPRAENWLPCSAEPCEYTAQHSSPPCVSRPAPGQKRGPLSRIRTQAGPVALPGYPTARGCSQRFGDDPRREDQVYQENWSVSVSEGQAPGQVVG
jgi:hypothetical protein